jgi:hypothetical protein
METKGSIRKKEEKNPTIKDYQNLVYSRIQGAKRLDPAFYFILSKVKGLKK